MKNRSIDTSRFNKKFSGCFWKKQLIYESKYIQEKEATYLKKNGMCAFFSKQVMNLLGSKIKKDLEVELNLQRKGKENINNFLYNKYQKKFNFKKNKLKKLLKEHKKNEQTYALLSKAKDIIFSKKAFKLKFSQANLTKTEKSKTKQRSSSFGIFVKVDKKKSKASKFENSFSDRTNKILLKANYLKSSRSAKKIGSKSLFNNYYGKKKRKQKVLHNTLKGRFISQSNNSSDLKHLYQHQKSRFFLTELSRSKTYFSFF
jgi:hypothetical protein